MNTSGFSKQCSCFSIKKGASNSYSHLVALSFLSPRLPVCIIPLNSSKYQKTRQKRQKGINVSRNEFK
jgi:hypothetical protein